MGVAGEIERELAGDGTDELADEADIADNRAGLEALTVSRPIARGGMTSATRGSFAVFAASASMPELEAGRDRAADVRAVCRDHVEVGGRAEVDDDGRRAVQPNGRKRVDEPVGTGLCRFVDAHRDGHVTWSPRRGSGCRAGSRRRRASW